jgi:hypothetical protein
MGGSGQAKNFKFSLACQATRRLPGPRPGWQLCTVSRALGKIHDLHESYGTPHKFWVRLMILMNPSMYHFYDCF